MSSNYLEALLVIIIGLILSIIFIYISYFAIVVENGLWLYSIITIPAALYFIIGFVGGVLMLTGKAYTACKITDLKKDNDD